MGRYDKSKAGFYPNYSKNENLRLMLNDTLKSILLVQGKNIKEARLRVLMNDVFEYLERFEGFHYGMFEKALQIDEKDINSSTVTLDHAVPSKVLIRKLKITNPRNKKALLDFFRLHYFICFITKEEEYNLDKKLRQKMPDTWNNNWQDWDARYRAKGIVLKVLPGK